METKSIAQIDAERAELQAKIDALTAENTALQKAKQSTFRLKVSEKGAVSIYGFGRFPVTVYKEAWLKLLDSADEIRAFIKANDSLLKSKKTA